MAVLDSSSSQQQQQPTEPARQQRRAPRARGFVIVVVVAIAAVLTAVVMAQLTSSQKLQVVGVRATEEMQARAIAEACLEMTSAWIDTYMPDPPSPPNPPRLFDDFDGLLLGPDGAANSPDDFMPPGIGVSVQIPKAAGDALHRYAFMVFPATGAQTEGGACAIRLDDNSDDQRPELVGVQGTPTDANEGPGAPNNGSDNPFLDRDLSIHVTAIGMYPVVAGTAAGDAYHKAHARVTLRRVIQKSNLASPLAPGLWAGTRVDMKNNNNVCATGGISADDIDLGNNSCACGPIITDPAGSSTGLPQNGDTCSCSTGCNPASRTSPPGGPPGPPLPLHWANLGVLLDNEALGPALMSPIVDPTAPASGPPVTNPPPVVPRLGEAVQPDPATGYDIANIPFQGMNAGESACAFYGRAVTPTVSHLFVWDRRDPDAVATLNGFLPASVVDPALVPLVGPISCTNNTSDPLPAPCTWSVAGLPIAGPAPGPTRVTCAAGQSPCWKLIAVLGDSAGSGAAVEDQDVSLGVALGAPNANIESSLNSSGIDEEWHPKRAAALPNVNGARGFGFTGAAAPASLLCGEQTACSSCNNVVDSTADNAGDGAVEWLESGGVEWTFDDFAHRQFVPQPAVWFLEGDVDLDRVGQAGVGPLRATVVAGATAVVTTATIRYTNGALCCATCDCSDVGTNVSVPGGGGCDFDANVNVRTINDKVSYDTSHLPTDGPLIYPEDPLVPNVIGGFALKSSGRINVSNNSTLIMGDVRAGTVDINDGCIIGNVAAYNTGPAGTCAGASAPCNDNHLCVDNNANMIGDLMSAASIEFTGNGVEVWSNVIARQSACFKNNAVVNGTIQVGDTVEFKNNATINNTSENVAGAAQAANAAVVTFSEATW